MSVGVLVGALRICLVAAAPFLLGIFLVGVVLGVVQAGTGVQDAGASNSVRGATAGLIALLAGPWVLRLIGGFTHDLWSDLGRFLF